MHVGAPPIHRKHPTSFHACTERGFSIKLFSGLTSKYSASFPESLILSWSQGARTCMRTSLRFEVMKGEHGCRGLCHLHTWLASRADLPLQGEVLVWRCFRHPNTRCILSLFPSRAWVASWWLGSSVDLGRHIRQEENWSERDRQVEEVVDQLASGGKWGLWWEDCGRLRSGVTWWPTSALPLQGQKRQVVSEGLQETRDCLEEWGGDRGEESKRRGKRNS